MTLLNFLINSKKLSAKYYPENKKDCKKMFVKDMKIILKKKKKKEPQHGHERSKNLSENEKQKLAE